MVASLVGAKGAMAATAIVVLAALAFPTVRDLVAPNDESVIAPISNTVLAPTAAAKIAPTIDRDLAPTPNSEIAPASDIEVAPTTDKPIAPASEASLEDVISRVLPAVAAIKTSTGRGTGFFIKPDQVLTNAHVVEGQTSVQLTVGTTTLTARVESVSTGSDLAVLRVYNSNPAQPVVRLGSVTAARPGQEVIAIGSALGVLSNTVTRGIVSSVRKVGEITLLQTDAAINPGNSGGPLIDRSGQVIGINTMGVNAARAEGVAFAVAVDHALPLIGGVVEPSRQTPLSALNQALDGRSESQRTRAADETEYERVLAWAEERSGPLDDYWNRYAPSCVSNAAPGGDRAWLAVFEPDGLRMDKRSRIDCQGWLATLTTNARPIHDAVARATEAARRRGVYPGALRELQRKHKLEWHGWSR
jgi:S1-C subfamily serine protease